MSMPQEKEKYRNRRNNKFRRRRQKKQYYLDLWDDYGFDSREDFEKWVDDMARKTGDLRSPCSCSMCGNARRHFAELTRAELKFLDFSKDSIKDLQEEL